MKKFNIIKRIMGLILCLTVVLTIYAHPAYASGLPSYSSKIFVTDNAKVLSEAVEDYIVNRCNTLRDNMMNNKNKEVNVLVLTIDFLPDGYDSEEYANAVANDWKIGSSEVDGMLILIVPGEYKQWITVSKGLEKYFTGGELTNIIYDHFPDEGFDENYDNAVKGVVDDVMDEMSNIYGPAATSSDYQGGSSGNGYNGYNNYNSYNSYGQPSVGGGGSFMWVIVAIVVLVVLLARPRRRYYGGGYGRPRGGFFFGPMFWGGPRGPRGPMGGGPRGGFGGGPRGGGFGGFGGGHSGFGGGHSGGGHSGGGFGGFGGGGGGFRGGGGGRK